MRSRTKLWFIMLISIVGSFLLFISLSFLTGVFWDKGYDLNKLNEISQQTLDAIEQQGSFDTKEVQPILDQFHHQQPALRFEWLSSDGVVLYDTSNNPQRYDFKQVADRFLNMPNNLWNENKPITLAYSANKDGQPYYLLISLPSEAMKQGQVYFFLRTFDTLFFWTLPLLLSFLFPYFLSLWFFSSIDRRIRKLNTALNQMSILGDVIVLEDKTKDEIGQLTRHYNAMAQRIRSQVDQIKQFDDRRRQLLSNLSHDLRTPLTMILGYAETIRTGAFKDENELQTSAKVILQRSRYMEKLLDQLLDISRLDEAALELNLTLHNLSELLRKIVADYMLFLDGQAITIEADIPDQDVEVWIDAALIERAVRNLLDNAIRYGSEGHFLELGLVENDEDVCITVKDRGRGIAPADQERIFERFYRADDGRKGEGLGLGLSIVQEIVGSHHGSVEVESTPYVETLFRVRVPKTVKCID